MISNQDVRQLPVSAGRAELLEEIMATPVTDHVEAAPPSPRRTPAWAVALAAVAAVLAIVALPIVLFQDDGTEVGPGGSPEACWDGSAGPTCTTPHGAEALEWVFPRLAGQLDRCEPALAASGDDPPMPFGTPGPGQGGAAYRCDLADLGIAAEQYTPRFWVYAFGAEGSEDVRRLHDFVTPEPFALGGEPTGQLYRTEVGLIRPDELFLATYDDYQFGVIAYASSTGEALDFLAALGARRPSEMEQPGAVDPTLPDFPAPVLLAPSETPSS